MKRLVPVLCLSLGYLAGSMSGPGATMVAQSAGAQSSAQPMAMPQASPYPAKTIYWPVDMLKKSHTAAVARAAAPQGGGGAQDPALAPFSLRFRGFTSTINHRSHYDKPR